LRAFSIFIFEEVGDARVFLGGLKVLNKKNISENELKTKLFWGFLAQTPYMKYIQ